MSSSHEPPAVPERSRQGQDGGWRPSDDCCVAPTLVIQCGAMAPDVARAIAEDVNGQLEGHVPGEALQWLHVPRGQEIPEDALRACLAPLLSLRLWQKLAATGAVRTLPSAGKPMNVRVLVLYEVPDPPDPQDDPRLLESLATTLESLLAGHAALSLCLIAVGAGHVDPTIARRYWPRIRLEPSAYGGTVADAAQVRQVCQTLVVALLASELVRAIDHAAGPTKGADGWLWLGASALRVDLGRMREYQCVLILRELIKPLLGSPLSTPDGQFVTGIMKAGVASLQRAMLADALDLASRLSWEGENQGRSIVRFAPKSITELGVSIDRPASRLAGSLAARHVRLREALARGLAAPASQRYHSLLEVVTFFLDPKAAQRQARKPFSFEQTPPAGLPAAVEALRRAIAELKAWHDIYDGGKAIHPHLSGDDRFLGALGEANADMVLGGSRAHKRLSSVLLSPLGIALKLLPAWLLLTGILLHITTLLDWQAALAAGLCVLAVGVAEHIAWRSALRSHLARLQHVAIGRLRESVLRLVARGLRDYRVAMAAHLQESAVALQRLLTLLSAMDYGAERHRVELEAWDHIHAPNQGAVHTLVDLERCRDWAAQAIRLADAGEGDVGNIGTALVQGSIQPLFQQPFSYRRAAREIERAARRLTATSFRSEEAEAYVLADRYAQLEGGLRWRWLAQKAHPLGQGSVGHERGFTVIVLSSDAPLVGAPGKASPHWGEDWLVARSRQPHEIICVRGVFEACPQEV